MCSSVFLNQGWSGWDYAFPLFWGGGLGPFQISLEQNRGVSEGKKERKNERKNKQTQKENDLPAKTTGMIQKTTVCSIKADGE